MPRDTLLPNKTKLIKKTKLFKKDKLSRNSKTSSKKKTKTKRSRVSKRRSTKYKTRKKIQMGKGRLKKKGKKGKQTLDIKIIYPNSEQLAKNIHLVKKDKEKKTIILLTDKNFMKTYKIPSAWKHLLSKNDPEIILINKKGLNIMINTKNKKVEAMKSVCPHMGVNNMWSNQGKNVYKCWAHGNKFKYGKELKKYNVKKTSQHMEIHIPTEKFSFFGGNNSCNHLPDIEDLV